MKEAVMQPKATLSNSPPGCEPARACGLVAGAGECEGPTTPCGPWRALRCPDLVRCLEGCEETLQASSVPPTAPAWKRVLDITCVMLAAPAWAPLMALAALFVKCASRGSVFFRQERVGFRGEIFRCLKFRTMRPDADASPHHQHLQELIANDRPMTKMDALGDSRLIRGGRFLRSSGLDELPQLLNVLRGEMSLVGPRPCTPFEYKQYSAWHRQRCNVLPGLTGLWQVSGKNKTTFRQMILLDLYYALHARVWIDLKIMLKTLRVLAVQIEETRQSDGAVREQPRANSRTSRPSLDVAVL